MQPTLWIGNTFRIHDETIYEVIKDGIGYVYILEIPNFRQMIENDELFDLTQEHGFVRPKSQDAYLMLDQPPRLPNPNSFIKHIIEIDRCRFQSRLTTKDLFPHPNEDEGYARLLDVPFVQLPSYYMNYQKREEAKVNNDETTIDLDRYFMIGKRALKIPFYVQDKNDLFDFNPKWKDTTIFEPSPFRLWKTESFNLEKIHKGQRSVFGETTKITISPVAYVELLSNDEEMKLEWPSIDSNSIFFTRAVLDHDKVINHSSPYYGIWLHKDNDLILEMHLIVDDNDNMQLEVGHAYIIDYGRLEYVKVENECACGKPEEHFKIIESLLKIHGLIEKQKMALVQHPFFIEKWFVLI